MAIKTTNPNRSSLAGRLAAEKTQAAETNQLKMRVACSWTLAKTMVPTAPAHLQLKVARNLLLNTTPVLKGMLRQAAINAHWTHVAEEFKNVHKTDLNSLLEDPSVLTKAKNSVTSELEGEAKSAAQKRADDSKENGVQPETYDEGKRTEPKGMDADGAADRPKIDLSKESRRKNAGPLMEKFTPVDASLDTTGVLGKIRNFLYGLDGTYTKQQFLGLVDEALDAPEGKAAARRKNAGPLMEKFTPVDASLDTTGVLGKIRNFLYGLDGTYTKQQFLGLVDEALDAPDGKTACADDCKGCKGCEKDKKKKKDASRKVAEDEEDSDFPKKDDSEDKDEEVDADASDDDAEQGVEDAEDGDEDDADDAEDQVFDEETATLEDAIEDVKNDVDTLQKAIEKEIGDSSEIDLAEESMDDDAFAGNLELDAPEDGMDNIDGQPLDDSQELNLQGIFSDDNFAEKVSALKDEEDDVIEDFDSFFSPSDAAELEGVLDQEETLANPADMFAVEGVDDDPLARLFASATKRASEEEGILKPGTLNNHFETDMGGDDRDSETDHEGDIFADVYDHAKQEETGDHRIPQDSEPELKSPAEKAAAASAARRAKRGKGVIQFEAPKLASHYDPLAAANKIAGGNLASLLFTDESDFA